MFSRNQSFAWCATLLTFGSLAFASNNLLAAAPANSAEMEKKLIASCAPTRRPTKRRSPANAWRSMAGMMRCRSSLRCSKTQISVLGACRP